MCASFLDLYKCSKAFNSLDHHLLLNKLFQLNVHPDVLRWFQDYLSDRWHRVKSSDKFSSGGPCRGHRRYRPQSFVVFDVRQLMIRFQVVYFYSMLMTTL